MRRLLAGLGAAALLMLALVAWPVNAAQVNVSIQSSSYMPPSVTINVNDTVQWKNNETIPGLNHTVTSDNGAFTPSGNIAPNQTFTIPFSAAGTYPYHCDIHDTMHGTVVVQAAPTTTVTTRPPATTMRPVATTRAAAATTRVTTATSVETSTTSTLPLETSTTEESTTTTSGDIAINTDDGGGTNGWAIAGLVVAIMAVLGGGGYAIYRLRAGDAA